MFTLQVSLSLVLLSVSVQSGFGSSWFNGESLQFSLEASQHHECFKAKLFKLFRYLSLEFPQLQRKQIVFTHFQVGLSSVRQFAVRISVIWLFILRKARSVGCIEQIVPVFVQSHINELLSLRFFHIVTRFCSDFGVACRSYVFCYKRKGL